MKLILAEKPSVGRTLASVLGCTKRNNGFSEGSDYIVTWALGHLVELSQPAIYGSQYKRWTAASLPILPSQLKVEPIERTLDQYKIVKSLLERDDIDSFIIATDAGREGELVARWILKLSNYKGKVQRLWISSQTDSAIKEGFAKLQDGDEYLNLFSAAESRAAADWYVGMNVTRALTCHYDAKISAGRVQTPTLSLMCERENEIEAFTGKFYWTIKADFGSFNASYYSKEDTIRIAKEETALKIVNETKNSIGTIENIEVVTKNEQPPQAYDLTELQRDANLSLGFSAKKTLDVLQKLYEFHKIVTYPRTDSRYITHDIVPTLPNRLKVLFNTPFEIKARSLVNGKMRIDEERFVRDELVSDHHAIIPTEQRINLDRLSIDEKELWKLIVTRFLEVLEEDYIYQTTSVDINLNNYKFKTRVTIPVKQGYRDIARSVGSRSSLNTEISGDINKNQISKLKINDTIKVKSVKSKKLSTDSPKRYNDATLLSAMEHAGRFVDDIKIKKNLTAGLGTPATRADIIEKLIHNNYIERGKNNELVPTARGREIVRLVPSLLKSPELTGQWEERLSNIAKGKEDSTFFIQDIKKCAVELVANVQKSHDSFSPNFSESKTCPFCKTQMMRVSDESGRNHYLCQKLSCSYEEMEVKKRVPLTESEIKEKMQSNRKKVVVIKKAKPVVVKKVITQKTKIAAEASSSAAYFSSLQKGKSSSSNTLIKPKVMIKKTSEIKTPSYRYETVIEVVRDSKLNRNNYYKKDFSRQNETKNWDNNKKHKFEAKEEGSTFADFIKASENRHKHNRNKKK